MARLWKRRRFSFWIISTDNLITASSHKLRIAADLAVCCIMKLDKKGEIPFMLKLEIRLNRDKICAEGKYTPDSLAQTLIRAFGKEQLDCTAEQDGTLVFTGRGCKKDCGRFGQLITALKKQARFMEYVERWVWYNSDDGADENDFAVEDVLLHYTNRASAA